MDNIFYKNPIKRLIKIYLKIVRFINCFVQLSTRSFPQTKEVALVVNVSSWKWKSVKVFLSDYEVQYISSIIMLKLFSKKLNKIKKKVIITWGYNRDEFVTKYARKSNIPVYRLEDGFIRSRELGSFHTPPYSLCLDKKGMYFDSTGPSDLEVILNFSDFQKDPSLILKARRGIKLITELGVSKYNHVNMKSTKEIYGPKTRKRILVIGQVEDDASIKKGSSRQWTNNELVRIASSENNGAEIIYKPHPDVLAGKRKQQSNPDDIRHLAKIIEAPLSLSDSFNTIDHVYTITSLAGFEALIRGITVTTLGLPFYSGWGLTDDRQLTSRRKRKLTIEELFAGAYILYPIYRDPYSEEYLTLEQTINRVKA